MSKWGLGAKMAKKQKAIKISVCKLLIQPRKAYGKNKPPCKGRLKNLQGFYKHFKIFSELRPIEAELKDLALLFSFTLHKFLYFCFSKNLLLKLFFSTHKNLLYEIPQQHHIEATKNRHLNFCGYVANG